MTRLEFFTKTRSLKEFLRKPRGISLRRQVPTEAKRPAELSNAEFGRLRAWDGRQIVRCFLLPRGWKDLKRSEKAGKLNKFFTCFTVCLVQDFSSLLPLLNLMPCTWGLQNADMYQLILIVMISLYRLILSCVLSTMHSYFLLMIDHSCELTCTEVTLNEARRAVDPAVTNAFFWLAESLYTRSSESNAKQQIFCPTKRLGLLQWPAPTNPQTTPLRKLRLALSMASSGPKTEIRGATFCDRFVRCISLLKRLICLGFTKHSVFGVVNER